MPFLKQPLIFPYLCHKSVTTCQIESYKVSKFKLKLDLCNCVKTEMIEATAPPQQPQKRGTTFFGTSCVVQNEVWNALLHTLKVKKTNILSSLCIFGLLIKEIIKKMLWQVRQVGRKVGIYI